MDQFVEINKLKINYRISGDGYPVVFLHGFLEDSSIWNKVLLALDNSFQVCTIDLPGHGNSGCPEHICTMEFMAECVNKILAINNISNPILLGHSMGGYVGLELKRITSLQLVLVHSNFWQDSDLKKEDRNRVINILESNRTLFFSQAIPNLFSVVNPKIEGIIQQLIKSASKLKIKYIQAVTRGMRDRRDNSELLNTDQDIYILQGEHDKVIPSDLMKSKLQRNFNSFIEIKSCGHMSFFEQEDEFNEIVLNICNKIQIFSKNKSHFK